MNILKIKVFTILICICFSYQSFGYDVSPALKNNKNKFVLAFYEGGQYPDYLTILQQTIYGLMDMGWIEKAELPDFGKDHKGFWIWANENLKSPYLEFARDGFFATGDFDKTLRESTFKDYLKKASGFDLVIAMGTWAGQDLANNEHKTPVMIASTSDPVGAGIIISVEDSGFDHIHAKVEPDRYQRQIKIFHEVTNFKRLGVIYENSKEGRTYAAMDALEQQSKNLHFELVPCEAAFSNIDIKDAEKNVLKCSESLVNKVDAIYITVHRGNTPENFRKFIKIFNQNKIATFSQLGADEVKNGALMSISQAGYKYVGQFHATVAARILKGESPRKIPQVYFPPARIALNMTTAEKIGFRPTVDILLAADEIAR